MKFVKAIGRFLGCFVESIRSGYQEGRAPPYANDKLSQVKALIDADLYINAIKKHRELFDSSLKDAKDAVDAMRGPRT